MNEVATIQQGRAVVDAHTAAEIRAQVNRIQDVMKAVMKEGTHYGVIPYTDKPTLYKAGSEVLLSTFHISVEPEVDDLSTSDEIRYRIRAAGVHQSTRTVLGIGIGECSSSEEKYKWRDAVCDEEFDDTDPARRRIKYQKKRGGGFFIRHQIRTEPADIANTVLKMAKKRAQIDMTLTALAASDIFTQDVEDMPEGYQHMADDAPNGKPTTAAPKATANGSKGATEKQLKLIGVKLSQSTVTEEELCTYLEIESVDALQFGQVNKALEFLKEHTE